MSSAIEEKEYLTYADYLEWNDERGCNGPPDLVIDILSPTNTQKERLLKFNLYLEAKVQEYWIVSPENEEIDVNIFHEGQYFHRLYGINPPDVKENERAPELVPVTVLPGLEIDTKDIFK